VTIRSVAIGDASSRWGSCSASGAIRYSWRLILAPPHLLDWVVAHEVAHRRHMDHGAAFRQLEASLYTGDVGAARRELRALGPRLKRIGRGR
jgi:predicted metal-dependent hydrolase